MDPDLIILGAGPCGLGLALEAGERGLRPLLVDRNDTVGGLCRTFRHGPYLLDLSIHRFQFDEPRVKQRLLALFAGQLHRVRHKSIHVAMGGARLTYPLKLSALLRIPPGCVAGAAAARLGRRLRRQAASPPRSYREWFEGSFGAPLYRWITGPLMEKQWGIPGESLCPSFGSHRRLSVQWRDLLGDVPLLSRVLDRAIPRQFLNGRLGIGPLMEQVAGRVAAAGGTVLPGRRPARLEHRGGRIARVHLDDGSSLPADRVASTIPLPALVGLLDPPPPASLLRAAAELRFRDLVVVGLALDRPRVSLDHVTYFPEPRFPFSRTFESKNASPHMAPEGRTMLGFELPCQAGDPLWSSPDAELLERMAAFGPEVGFSPGEVLGGTVLRVPEAYPIYQLGYRERADALLSWIHGRLGNLYAVGRNSLLRLDNMNHAFVMGFDLARHLASGRSPGSWHALLSRYNRLSYID